MHPAPPQPQLTAENRHHLTGFGTCAIHVPAQGQNGTQFPIKKLSEEL
jgi:hypothetical protein